MLCLFDLDGTLIDSGQSIYAGIRYALASVAVEAPDESVLRDWIGPPLRLSFSELLGDHDRVEAALDAYRQRFAEIGWREHTVYPGIPAAIDALHRAGHRMAVVTSKLRTHAEPILAELPFGQRFARLYGPGPDSLQSEKASMIATALADFHADPTDTVMIGDRRYDIEGAVANQVRGIGVLWGFGDRHELEQAGAHVTVETPAQLTDLLLG
ncbi:MAG: HAD hydrolase-like protein [Dyella sp.]